jgi:hypothetical protein
LKNKILNSLKSKFLHSFSNNKKMKKLFLLLVCVLSSAETKLTNKTETCASEQTNKYLTIDYDDKKKGIKNYSFRKFKNFTELVLGCNQTYNKSLLNAVRFIPGKQMLLNNDEFRLEKLFKIDSDYKMEITFTFRNFGGLVLTNLRPSKSFFPEYNDLLFEVSRLDLYLNSQTKLKSSQCNRETFENLTSLIRNFPNVIFFNTAYPREGLCSFIFSDTQEVLTFGDVINSLLIQNRLTFIETNSTILPLKKIVFLAIEVHYESLRTELLYRDLFLNIKYFKVMNILNGIESGLLRKFIFLNEIIFELVNFKAFLHGENTKWMLDINVRVPRQVNMHDKINIQKYIKNTLYVTINFPRYPSAFSKPYVYPSEDICLFKDFPHTRLVMPLLNPFRFINCTCTLMWLQQYYFLFFDYIKKDSVRFIKAAPSTE